MAHVAADAHVAPEGNALFVFGTLMHRPILERVLGHDGADLAIVDADLPGFSRHHLRLLDYPAIVPAAKGWNVMGRELTEDEATVRGRLVTGLTAADIGLLDVFEGDEYRRELVDVVPLSSPASSTRAHVYVWAASTRRLEARLWSYDDFVRDKASRWVSPESDADEGFSEVDRRRAKNGLTSPVEPLEFGRALRGPAYFAFEPADVVPLNHGAYGKTVRAVVEAGRRHQDHAERNPDQFTLRDRIPLHKAVRARVAKLVHCHPDELVLAGNNTTAVNSIMRSLEWRQGDVLVYFMTSVYGSNMNLLQYIRDSRPELALRLHGIDMTWPISDNDLVERFEQEIVTLKADGSNVRLAIFDAISSVPAVRLPWERLVEVCRRHDVFSMVDGAHAVGQIELDMSKAQPDAFTSNLHKWSYVFRGCALLYVPFRNQHVVRSLTRVVTASMVNVRIPLHVPTTGESGKLGLVVRDRLMDEHKTNTTIFAHAGKWYARLSAQIYNDESDFEHAAHAIQAVCASMAPTGV